MHFRIEILKNLLKIYLYETVMHFYEISILMKFIHYI